MGESILYATDLGVTAISSVVVQYSYSSFSQAAVDYAYRHGVLLSLDSNDFDAMDHSDGMLFAHVFPGSSLSEDRPAPATRWFRSRSNVTSYGTHAIFSGEENSTSGATPFQAGMLAIVQAAALNARDPHLIPDRLTPDEVKQVLMDTASPVIPQTQAPSIAHQWPGNPASATNATHTNWSTQYGYGRPDLGAATRLVLSGRVPPTAEIDSPPWYDYVDPVTQRSAGVGRAGTQPLALGRERAVVARVGTRSQPGRPLLPHDRERCHPRSPGGHPGTAGSASDPGRLLQARPGIDAAARGRSIGVRHDPTLLAGFPKRIGGEIAAGPSYVDLNGRHQLDLVYGTADGDVDALAPDGRKLPGFPVYTDLDRQIDPANPENFPARAYRTVPALRDVRDPIVGIAVGELRGDGSLDVVATTSNADVYAWNASGHRLPGFPVSSARRYWSLPVPTPAATTAHSRLPARGAWAPPVLARLQGGRRLDILMSAYDGHVYAWQPDGRTVPGWPVQIELRDSDFARLGVQRSGCIRDSKLMYAVTVGDVLRTGRPQVFVSSFECDGANPAAFLYGVWADGNRHRGGAYLPGWPVRLPSLQECYDQSIDFVGEGTSPPVIGNFDAGRLQVVSSPVTGPVYVINGDGTIARTLSPGCASAACAPDPPYRPSGDSLTLTLTGQGGLADLTNSGHPEFLQSSIGAQSISNALNNSGQAALPQAYEKAWDVATGAVAPGFPVRQDRFPFFDAPLAADLGDDGTRQVIEGNDSYWVHAWDVHGGEVPGFPKYTGQWPSFSGVVGDATMTGQLRYAVGTREGWLFVWRVRGDARLDGAWSHLRGDDYNAGLYGLDSRRPAAILDLRRRGTILRRTAPGADYELGRAFAYLLLACRDRNCVRARRLAAAPRPAPAGTPQRFALPALPSGTRYLAVRSLKCGRQPVSGQRPRVRAVAVALIGSGLCGPCLPPRSIAKIPCAV